MLKTRTAAPRVLHVPANTANVQTWQLTACGRQGTPVTIVAEDARVCAQCAAKA
jgi:hypothetical protein